MKNYTKIPNELLDESQLSFQARYLLCVLLKYAGKDDSAYPSQKTLGRIMNRSERQIRNILDELIVSKVVLKERTGFNKSNTYYLSKSYERDRKQGSYHLRSMFPINRGNPFPTKSTYRKVKEKTKVDRAQRKFIEEGRRILGRKMVMKC